MFSKETLNLNNKRADYFDYLSMQELILAYNFKFKEINFMEGHSTNSTNLDQMPN